MSEEYKDDFAIVERYDYNKGKYFFEKVNSLSNVYWSNEYMMYGRYSNYSSNNYFDVKAGTRVLRIYRDKMKRLKGYTTFRFEKSKVNSLIGDVRIYYWDKELKKKIEYEEAKYQVFDSEEDIYALVSFEEGILENIFNSKENANYVEIQISLHSNAYETLNIKNDSNYILKDGGMYKTIRSQKLKYFMTDIEEHLFENLDIRLEEDGDIISFLIRGKFDKGEMNFGEKFLFKNFISGTWNYFSNNPSNNTTYLPSIPMFNDEIIHYVSFRIEKDNRFYIHSINISSDGQKITDYFTTNSTNFNETVEKILFKMNNLSEFAIFDKELTRYEFKKYAKREVSLESLEPENFIIVEEKGYKTKDNFYQKENVEKVYYKTTFIEEVGEQFPTGKTFLEEGFPLSVLKDFTSRKPIERDLVKREGDIFVNQYNLPYENFDRIRVLNIEEEKKGVLSEWQELA